MNRKTFLTTIVATLSAPFIGKSKEKEPEPKLPRDKVIEVDDVEDYVKKMVEREISLNKKIVIKPKDLVYIHRHHPKISRWK